MVFVDYTNLRCPSKCNNRAEFNAIWFQSCQPVPICMYLLEDKVKFLNLMAFMNVRLKPNVPV